jgi:hypothetical protein
MAALVKYDFLLCLQYVFISGSRPLINKPKTLRLRLRFQRVNRRNLIEVPCPDTAKTFDSIFRTEYLGEFEAAKGELFCDDKKALDRRIIVHLTQHLHVYFYKVAKKT